MEISSEQLRAARALIRWEQRDLAEASKVSLGSIKRLESQPGLLAAQPRTVDTIRAALEAAGVEFTNGGQPGVRLARVDAKCAKCGYAGTIEQRLEKRFSGVPAQCPAGYSPIACPEFRKAVSAARTALSLPNPEKAAEFAAKARGDRT
jgi:transcriptional regulator with XRE-family HTH domain